MQIIAVARTKYSQQTYLKITQNKQERVTGKFRVTAPYYNQQVVN